MMAPLVRRTWAPRGQTPIFIQQGRWHKKVSAIAALTVPPRRMRVGLYFSLHADANITATRVVRFLRNLCAQIQKPLIIVWDRSNTHRAKVVTRFFERRRKLHREFLPPYAPDINPVEMVWSYLKSNPMANLTVGDVGLLSKTARYHALRLRQRKSILRSFLRATPLFSRQR